MVARTPIALSALLVSAAVACTAGVKKPACGSRDAGLYEVGIEAPPGCPPAQANEIGIGRPCTMCGNECTAPLRCACDSLLGVQLSGVPCVCTLLQFAQQGSTDPCKDQGANWCGSNTTCCNALTTAAYCVPNACLPNGACVIFNPPDAGTD
jgi:hypothetical protein